MVSIIVPVYNVGRFLDVCLTSILKQSYTNIEILVIDDGSTDNSYSIALKYAGKDARVKVLHKENSGVSDARNMGLELAKGQYIMFVDADDYINYKMVEILRSAMSGEVLLSICDSMYVDGISGYEENLVKKVQNIKWTYMKSHDEFLSEFNGHFGMCDKLINRKLIKNIRFNSEYAIGEDLLFNSMLLSKNDNFRVAVCYEKLYFYVQHSESAIHNDYSAAFYKQLYAAQSSYEMLKKVTDNPAIGHIMCNAIGTFYAKYASADYVSQKKYRMHYVAANNMAKKYRKEMKINKQGYNVKKRLWLVIESYLPRCYLVLFKIKDMIR